MAEIIRNEPLAGGIYRMRVSGAPLGRAGQFFMLRVPGVLDPLLGRPISICEIDASAGATTFVYQTIGRGTAQFSNLLPGQQIDAQGPYGNGFSLKASRAVLIGGGIGTARHHFQIEAQRKDGGAVAAAVQMEIAVVVKILPQRRD